MIKGFAHICFTVRNLDSAIAFYQGKLGFRHGFDYLNDQGKRFGVYLHISGRNFIELFQGDVDAPPEKPAYRHFCLEVDETLRKERPPLFAPRAWKSRRSRKATTEAGRPGSPTPTATRSSCRPTPAEQAASVAEIKAGKRPSSALEQYPCFVEDLMFAA